VLISVQDHILESAETKWAEVAELIGSTLIVQVVLVHALELNGQFDLTLLRLLVEDGQNLLANVPKSKLLLVETEVLPNLVFATID
jgi:hypothetical protein